MATTSVNNTTNTSNVFEDLRKAGTAPKKELGKDYPVLNGNGGKTSLSIWYEQNPKDIIEFEKQMIELHPQTRPTVKSSSDAKTDRKDSFEASSLKTSLQTRPQAPSLSLQNQMIEVRSTGQPISGMDNFEF